MKIVKKFHEKILKLTITSFCENYVKHIARDKEIISYTQFFNFKIIYFLQEIIS